MSTEAIRLPGGARPAHQGEFSCPACGVGELLEPLYGLRGIPVQSTLLLPSREAALAFPTGDLELVWCGVCGFAFNARFSAELVEYGAGYEDAQGGSPTFNAFAADLARGWIDRYALTGKHVAEIGCGKGDFLRLICAECGCTGTGFDPAYVRGRTGEPAGVAILAENFTDQHVPLDADFVICRHTLEHIGDTAGFLRLVRRACDGKPTIRLGFEVPDLRRILVEGAFWDVYYEHAGYFTAGSLARAFQVAGFTVLDVRRVYGGQYLVIEAAPGNDRSLPPIADDLEETTELVSRFRDAGMARIRSWRTAFSDWRREGRSVALWGSGSKAVGFVTTIGDPGVVIAVADINPARQGRYMPGCAMPIVAPEALAGMRPDVVIVMNPIYRDEIAAQIESMGLAPTILTADGGPGQEGPG